ncbi:MAG TPA: AmmeMemoRadiSam system protein A [Planctomycetota bacterium]|nr:AmmeMemoRadiSam system protein A [Planctomycetota bacterium]
MHDLSALPAAAREAIRARLLGRPPGPPRFTLPRAAVFVTLRIRGELRGCMGTLDPQHDDLVRETMERAVVAAFDDPRFPPLAADEIDACAIEVTVLGPLEPARLEDLDPARYGIEVRDAAGRRAVLLPGIEGIETAAAQVAACRRKAGIRADAPVAIRRFSARKVEEEGPGEP